ncbi:MAG TPA: AMMECR1 domain-containing protein [Thermoanaerobaculia bacterium]
MLSTEVTLSGLDAAREELRLLLRQRAILYEGPDQPVLGRDGGSAPWMFYSWGVSLTARGARLAAECFLDRLRGFESTQIATFGYTGMPLLSACVLLGGGRYEGLCIRERRKAYGSCRQIEGNVDRSRPVVVLDDSLSSGTSMRKAIQALEEEGLAVEGGVALVYFPYRGGAERALGLGYRVEWIFDVWKDLEMPRPVYVPGFRRALPGRWGAGQVADGLHPAEAARRIAEAYLDSGEAPRPPARLGLPVDGRGGVYVSFREPESEKRLARDGFWHFNAADADPCRDLVLATVKTIRTAEVPVTRENLDRLKIAVTFLGPLERIAPRQLDYWRYGIVVRSRAWPTKVGGALPNTQVFTHELEQYRHARFTNADLTLFEPHDLYRHEVAKYVEPGAGWLLFGAAEDEGDWTHDAAVGERLTARARELLAAAIRGERGEPVAGEPVSDELIPAPVYAVGVTLYHRGLGGCTLAWSGSLDDCLGRAARGALGDRRFKDRLAGVPAGEIDLVVSILHDREWVGELPTARVARKLRLGLDALAVQQGERAALFLPSVAVDYNWSKEQLVAELMRKAGIAGSPCQWATFRTATWVGTKDGAVRRLWFGFPVRGERPRGDGEVRADAALLASYLMRSRGPDGLPEYEYLPIEGRRTRDGTAARVVHALAALDEAGRFLEDPAMTEAARDGLRFCVAHVGGPAGDALALPGLAAGPMAIATLLETLAGCGEAGLLASAAPLADRLLALLRPDGRISERLTGAADHDYLPGAVLLALARYWSAGGAGRCLERLAGAFAWYRRRFRMLQPWGMAGWHTRAWTAVHALSRDPEHAAFVFEIADWALDWQHERTGAFITDLHEAGPSFHTAFLIEGIADAWALALELGDERRAAAYGRSWREAVRFLDQLIIRREDTFCMADAERALGGVRSSRANSDVRIDFVSHTLLALIQGARLSRNKESLP